MEGSKASLNSLPNEILIQILNAFDTKSLLPLAVVNRLFCGLVGRLHYSRMVAACALHEHEMILECYHPSVKITTPTLFCEYLGTDGIQEVALDDEVSFSRLNSLYTRFRPYQGDRNLPPRARYSAQQSADQDMGQFQPEKPSHDLFLEGEELFTQLCTVASLVKVEPRKGLFCSIAKVSDGVIRVWRDWLAREAAEASAQGHRQTGRSILWTDLSESVGLRFTVVEDKDFHVPILLGHEDEPPVAYTLEFEEMFVRTNQLLLSYEESLAEQVPHPGKAAMIISM